MPKYYSYEYPEPLLNWFENHKDNKTLFITDPSGTVKTEGTISLLKDYNPLKQFLHSIFKPIYLRRIKNYF